jgi:acetyl-CoA carboxylase biotin carboxyl carrier protein
MTLTFKEVSEIIKIIDASECEEVVLELEGMRLVVRRGGDAGRSSAPAVPSPISGASTPATVSPPVAVTAAVAQAGVASKAPEAVAAGGAQVRAPMVGSFYRRPSPDEPPYVEVGTMVEAGEPLCLIEVMKLYTTIESPVAGIVKQIAAEDTQLVEFDQLLFVIEPANG